MNDQKLVRLITGPTPASIDDVMSLMAGIDAVLPGNDGLKWFNYLYLEVTKEVRDRPPAAGWTNPAWLTRLDVVFAGLYFSAIQSSLQGNSSLASSWAALFEVRYQPGIDRIQFALAGMNAHINHDLSLALIQTNLEFGIRPDLGSREHSDYERVNDLLEAVMPAALQTLATGLLGEIAQDTGRIGQLLAIWSVRAARDLAWDFGDHLTRLDGLARDFAVSAQDRTTGALGRSLLLPH